MLDFDLDTSNDALLLLFEKQLAEINHKPCKRGIRECDCFHESNNFDEWLRMVSGAIHKLTSGYAIGDIAEYGYAQAYLDGMTIGDCVLDSLRNTLGEKDDD